VELIAKVTQEAVHSPASDIGKTESALAETGLVSETAYRKYRTNRFRLCPLKYDVWLTSNIINS
jgi:hypothetical protein